MTEPKVSLLENWIEKCVASIKDAPGFDVPQAHHGKLLLLYGMATRVMRYSDAYLLLARSELLSEAVVLARTALEHAIALQWIFIVDGGIGRFQVSMAHEHANYGAVAKLGGEQRIIEHQK